MTRHQQSILWKGSIREFYRRFSPTKHYQLPYKNGTKKPQNTTHNIDEYEKSLNDDEDHLLPLPTKRERSSPNTYQDIPILPEIQMRWRLIKSQPPLTDSPMKNENDTFERTIASNVTKLDISAEIVDLDRTIQPNPVKNDP